MTPVWGSSAVVGALATIPLVLSAQPQRWNCPDPSTLIGDFRGEMAHVRYLADDKLEGRAVATQGERCAGEYIADRFRSLGLQPVGDDGSWFQGFTVRVGTELGQGSSFITLGEQGEVLEVLRTGADWAPYGFSGPASAAVSPVVAYPLDDLDDAPAHRETSLTGSTFVMEGVAPHPHAPAPDPHREASRATGLGASALIVLLDEAAPLPSLEQERRAALSIPVLAVKGRAAEAVRAAVGSATRVSISVALTPLYSEARNVAALLLGRDSSSSQTLVIGAHYDHLGLGGPASLSPDNIGVVNNGADDNASGTAVLLEVARQLVKQSKRSHNVLFLAFTGEERGLWGSSHYVESPLLPLESTVAMLNLDMVGRVQGDALTVFGTGTAEEWPQLLERANDRLTRPFSLQAVADGFGASDHSSFYASSIPVLHFFSNTHPQYHRVEDDWELVNADGMARVTELVVAVVSELEPAGGDVVLTLVEGAGGVATPIDGSTVRSGFQVRLGTIPDYSRESGGMRITGVRDGSPAAKAGLIGGDIIVRLGDHEIEDIYAYMYALQEFEPGDEVDLVIVRDGERLVVPVVLEAGN